MTVLLRPVALGLVLALAASADLAAQQGPAPTRVVGAPMERAWLVTESVLKSLGWEVDESDRAVGWILTDSRGVDFKDFAVYGKGTRHRLRVTLRSVESGRTAVSVDRELYTEERILWMKDRKPVSGTDRSVELAVLDAIEKALP